MVGRRELQQCYVSSFLNRGANTVDIEKLWVLFSLFFSFSPFSPPSRSVCSTIYFEQFYGNLH